MPAFLAFIEFLVAIGLIVALASNYLIINKLWKRRAVKEVAESISIWAALLGLFTSIPFLIHFLLIEQSAAGAAKTSISIATGVVFVAVGSGVFVAELRERGFWNLLLRALNVERRESGDLIRQLARPKGADRILRILQQLASVDGTIDEREAALIRSFAESWHMPVPPVDASDGDIALLAIRDSVTHYLALRPPREQAAQLRDLLYVVARADARMSWEESVALDEIGGLLRQYSVDDPAGVVMHEVLIVPQSEAQIEAVRTLLPGTEEATRRGGRVFSVGHFFSPQYAEIVCQKYIALGLFTTIVTQEPAEPVAPSAASPAPAPHV